MRTPEQAASDYRAVVAQHRFRETSSGFRMIFDLCESPIEQAFCLTLFQNPGVCGASGEFNPAILPSAPEKPYILVYAQHPILRFRADFLLVGVRPLVAEPTFVIIECDGQAYHSTREQIRRDEARQQALVNTGFGIVRHTGSEIFRDPKGVLAKTIGAFSWLDVASFVRAVDIVMLWRALAELRAAAEQIGEVS